MKKVRIAAGVVLAATIVAGWASVAAAHVTVQPNTAEKGKRAVFVVRVPNESASASTIKIEVQTPSDSPITGVRVQPKPGWDVAMERSELATPLESHGKPITDYISKITWTAQPGVKIGPDQFDDFPFSVGPLPTDVDQLAFKAIQTYDGPLDDGSTEARWVEVAEEGKKVDRPEAVVKLTEPAEEATAGEGTTAAATGDAEGETATGATDAADTASTARTIAIFGLILGVVAVALAGAAFAAKGRSTAGADAES